MAAVLSLEQVLGHELWHFFFDWSIDWIESGIELWKNESIFINKKKTCKILSYFIQKEKFRWLFAWRSFHQAFVEIHPQPVSESKRFAKYFKSTVKRRNSKTGRRQIFRFSTLVLKEI